MTDLFADLPVADTRPELPEPALARWQPLRLGLVELFRYDSEEFWFRDGHLLLRGNNGTGKSKVLSLTLPFLFDAQLKPSRIEPDGDPGKKMAWNLLLGEHERRTGYAWIEFGRLDADGQPRYLTLGAGLAAVAARPQVDPWYFVLEARRIGQDFWLTSRERVVLNRDALANQLEGCGQVFATADAYRRAVDERLFRLGQARYAALMDTLIQLRQPQLSKKPDEGSLSDALTEALPPLSADLLTDVADALNQLEEYRRELEEYEALARAVGQFNRRYQVYAGTQTRRQARQLRGAQSGFEGASRELNAARAALQTAQAEEAQRQAQHAQAELALEQCRTRLEALQADPANQDANRLEQAVREMDARRRDAEAARRALEESQRRWQRESAQTQERAAQLAQAEQALAAARQPAAVLAQDAGIAEGYGASPLAAADPAALAELETLAFDTARGELRQLAATRREQIALVQRLRAELDQAEQHRLQMQRVRDERSDEAGEAALRRDQADAEVERQGRVLLDAWQGHFDGLRQLRLDDAQAPLAALADWVVQLQGDNPARRALQAAQQQASQRLAERQAALDREQRECLDEQQALLEERARLERGEDAQPPAPYPRAAEVRQGRAGAPLWQLLEFRPHLDAAQRAGLEAALEASALLDAWVTPDGSLQTADGNQPLHDTQWQQRPRRDDALANWLMPAAIAEAPVAAERVARLLQGIACGGDDPGDAEAWIAADGRFRLGALAGAWSKPAAAYIGYAARAAARARRLAEIDARLQQLAAALQALQAYFEELAGQRRQAAAEWQNAPGDDGLRTAHADAAARAREYQMARSRLDQAEAQFRDAEQKRQTAAERLASDARDLRLPEQQAALERLQHTLAEFGESLHAVFAAAQELRRALPELQRQQQREDEARLAVQQGEEDLAHRRGEAEAARVRFETLRESVGARVDELQQRLVQAREAVREHDAAGKAASEALRKVGEARARAEQKAQDCAATLQERSAARQQAIAALQGFAATGLLSLALPEAELPDSRRAAEELRLLDSRQPWSIEPALNLARRAEQALTQVKDDDEAWSRIQSQVSQDYSELLRALAALSHQAQAETNDYGLIVTIVYQNRPERPDQLTTRLAGEIAQRRELLTAGERKVLENHLQAEIAAAVQKLLQDAERQVQGINAELAKRPTSTGVRFRLLWQPLAEGAEGAPVGLEAARKRLLNTSTDLWSAEDRQVVGAMLHERIAAERARVDAGGGSLLEQLSRALDYRRWHSFRVQRWQDGQWRKLSGPASSGERALGLTVPLFAAVASFYSQGGYAHAPRLVLLDEAFAGIDDAARAHCMGLIREFDLDFVITSEREWACYAALPGVSICQLQRREGVDAVFVSRWTWDGQARRREDDPDRRFAPEDTA
ncbi:MAG: TIGR02680 family protein [Methylococcaceae bacterium]|nr:MAG: TIGR02680 family protein [Methylococcaceae bacterium]